MDTIEEQLAESVSEEEAEEEMAMVELKLFSLQMVESCTPNEDTETEYPPLAICQICMDVFGYHDIIRSFCGTTCLAEVCLHCLVQHLTASVYSYYPGVLPKLRCPICLTLLNKAQWAPYVIDNEDHSYILEKYSILCTQSCGFQSPCCHNTEYTMLPKGFTRAAQEEPVEVPIASTSMVSVLREKVQAYSRHQVDADELYTFISDHFPTSVFEQTLRSLQDEERRATLLLYDLYLHPNTYTTCCHHQVCFKCKVANHHDQCMDFLEELSVLECPSCRITLVKVDGCNSVVCLCGQEISWSYEVKKQRLQRKQLVPQHEYNVWFRWKQSIQSCLNDIKAMESTWRMKRLNRLIDIHRLVLKKMIQRAVRRARLRLITKAYRTSFIQLLRRFRHRHQMISSEKERGGQGEEVRLAIAPAA